MASQLGARAGRRGRPATPSHPRPSTSLDRLPEAPPPPVRTAPPRPTRCIATWTVVAGGYPVSWASRSRWAAQHRPLRGTDLARVPAPFSGLTLQERHPSDPLAPLTPDEARLLCPLCGVPEFHRAAHRRGPLHQARLEAARTNRASSDDVAAAVALLRRLQPQLLAAPSSPASPAPGPSGLQAAASPVDDLIDMSDDF